MKKIIVLAAAILIPMPVCAQDIPLSKILVVKEGWREVAKGLPKVEGFVAEPAGSVKIYQGPGEATFHLLAPNGVLKLEKRSKDHDGEKGIFLGESATHRIVQTSTGQKFYVTYWVVPQLPDPEKKGTSQGPERKGPWEVMRGGTGPGTTLRMPGITEPTCITLWPDDSHLVIGESDGAYLWAVRIEKDGSFGAGDRYYSLQTKPGVKMHVAAMTMDAGYLLYACTPLGIQVFDPTGRLCGVITAPSKEPMTAITIGGANANELFIAAGDKIFARKIQGQAPYTLKKAK